MRNDEGLHQVYLGLGSNLGNKEENIRKAITLINEQIGTVETEPWGFRSDNMFVNAVVRVSTQLTPMQLLRTTQQIERDMGRRKNLTVSSSPGEPRAYHDRPIDIDILLYDDWTVDEPELKIPHPLMQERDFVMIPLREICDAITYADPEPSRWHDND